MAIGQKDMKRELAKSLVANNCIETCLNCDYWDEFTLIEGEVVHPTINHCTKYNQVPPPEIIVYGCEQYEPELPF